MPEIKPKAVVSCSSEDPKFAASNLLVNNGSKSWKCQKVSPTNDKQITVVLQLESQTHISSIDIGNDSSAFIEILVGNSSDGPTTSFSPILVASSFMNPTECRDMTNSSRVRMFPLDKLDPSTRDKKWDRVKLVCSQPFNRTAQYGVAFIRLTSPEDRTEKKQKTLGGFILNAEAEDPFAEEADYRKPGSLFKKRSSLTTDDAFAKSPSASAIHAIKSSEKEYLARSERNESLNEKKQSVKTPVQLKQTPQSGSSSTFGSLRPERDSASTSHAVKRKADPTPAHASTTPKRPYKDTPTPLRQHHSDNKKQPPKEKVIDKEPVEFNEIMDGVVFALSGFQNPKRSDLREKAIQMGAVYKPDWVKGVCTHLICAFKNTPKFNAVRGKGRITSEKWILDCFNKQRPISWRRYAFEDVDSDSDSFETPVKPRPKKVTKKPEPVVTINTAAKKTEESKKQPSAPPTGQTDPDPSPSTIPTTAKPNIYDASTDENGSESGYSDEEEDGNTDDEIDRHVARGAKTTKPIRVSPPKDARTDPPAAEASKYNKQSPRKSTPPSRPNVHDGSVPGSNTQEGSNADAIAAKSPKDPIPSKESKAHHSPSIVADPTSRETSPAKTSPTKPPKSPKKASPKKSFKIGPDGLPELPDPFVGCVFFIFGGNLSDGERRALKRTILAYDGSLVDYMGPTVTHVLTSGPWDEDFDDASEEFGTKLHFVDPEWVVETGRKGDTVPIERFLIKKS